MGRKALLRWYAPRRRLYPWRTTRDPYRVLVSEVMLQQTQASRVVPAFGSFLTRFPTVQSLARARLRDVVTAWEGLGYNRRAVALWEAARAIVQDHGGAVPADPVELQRLAGVGPYTAAAVSAVAFGSAAAAVDTNVRRIVTRFFLGADPDDVSPREVRALAEAWLDRRDPGAWNQALMDLGREHCRPRPRCGGCPLRETCRFVAEGREPQPARRRQPAFEGSFRQMRGAVVRALRARDDASLAALARETGAPLERVGMAVSALAASAWPTDGNAAGLAPVQPVNIRTGHREALHAQSGALDHRVPSARRDHRVRRDFRPGVRLRGFGYSITRAGDVRRGKGDVPARARGWRGYRDGA